jgi:hypothetical protein
VVLHHQLCVYRFYPQALPLNLPAELKQHLAEKSTATLGMCWGFLHSPHCMVPLPVCTHAHTQETSLAQIARRGTARGQPWLLTVLGQLYADKALADDAADRMSTPRPRLRAFLQTWHGQRYGLRSLSQASMTDLLASALAHGLAGFQPARWFLRFCGLGRMLLHASGSSSSSSSSTDCQDNDDLSSNRCDSSQSSSQSSSSDSNDDSSSSSNSGSACSPSAIEIIDMHRCLRHLLASPGALDAYVFFACQLAHPHGVAALYPNDMEVGTQPLLHAAPTIEALRAVFRCVC